MSTTFAPREVTGCPSTERTAFLKRRYLEAPLMLDVEYLRHLTASHRRTDGLEVLERRAEDHAFALENLTPILHPRDRIAGNKTRFARGAVPYANYAATPFLREMRREEQDPQQRHVGQGTGGGIGSTRRAAEELGLTVVSGKFLVSQEEREEFLSLCTYWEGKSFLDASERLWRADFAGAGLLEAGWKVGLYTAPHEPCPEGRIVLDFETALSRGLTSLADETEERIRSFRPGSIASGQKLHFWRAARRVLAGALRWTERWADEAARQASAESDPARRTELLELERSCRQVPARPPRSFREAVQAFWSVYLLGHLEGAHLGYSPGRLDQTLWPYWQADPAADLDEAVELFEELFLKMTQIEYVASLSWQGLGHGNLYQNLILGGVDGAGRPADNALSLAMLQAAINVQTTQPTLSVWWDPSLSERFLEKAAECVKTGVGYPAFFNQRVYVAHEMATSGLPLETVRARAAIGGCTEPVLAGMSYGVVQAGFVNHGKLLDLALHDGVDPATGLRLFPSRPLGTFEEVVASYREKMHEAVRCWQRYWNLAMLAHRQTVPLVFCSVLVRDCLGRGISMDDGGALLNDTPTTLSSGLVNVANSLAAVRRLCFSPSAATTLDALRGALSADWEGHDLLRRRALDCPKWGNDDDEVDTLFLALFDDYVAWVKGQENALGRPYDPSMLAISTPVPFGKVCGAFPDGRRAGEPLADGVTSPYPGTDTNGPTAVLRSSAKVDHTKIRGGLLNLKFHPTALAGTTGSKNLLALVRTYFEGPGFHLQFNVVDSEMLRDAQEHPESYRDLVVRVAGFSAYWVEMSRALQDQVIARTEHVT